MTGHLAARAPRPGESSVNHRLDPAITEPELELLVAYLRTGKLIAAAQELGLPEATAKNRLRRLYQRHGWRNIAEAIWQHRAEIERHLAA